MESLVPFQASYSMADLIKDWDQALGELQHGDEAIFSLCHVELLSQTATALTAISDLNSTYSSALTPQGSKERFLLPVTGKRMDSWWKALHSASSS